MRCIKTHFQTFICEVFLGLFQSFLVFSIWNPFEKKLFIRGANEIQLDVTQKNAKYAQNVGLNTPSSSALCFVDYFLRGHNFKKVNIFCEPQAFYVHAIILQNDVTRNELNAFQLDILKCINSLVCKQRVHQKSKVTLMTSS